MRLFIALDFNPLEDEFRKIQDRINSLDIKATYPKEFHLTLKFMGEIDDDKVEDLIARLDTVSFHPFTATLERCGVFPSESYIRVIWFGIREKETISALARDIGQALDSEPDSRFHPHITLARVKHVGDKEELVDLMKELRSDRSIKITSFSLIRSTLTPEGPVYETIREFPSKNS